MGASLHELGAAVHELHRQLDHASYYDMLGIPAYADYVRVREAFHARAQSFHPDRFVCLDDPQVQRESYEVYKRITEAYNVLSDPQLRVRYDDAVDRGLLRLAPEDRNRRLDAQERQLSNPFARIYLRAARSKRERGDLRGAGLDLALALSLEDAAPLRALRDEVLRSQARQAAPLTRTP